ncbi:MAG: hypothetical protein QM765_23160 [Myxococcales bacterium]
MPGKGRPTEPSSYSPGGVMVMPPVASVMPKPEQSSMPWPWKKRKTCGARYPAAESPQRSLCPTTLRSASLVAEGDAASPALSRARASSCAQRMGMETSPVGSTCSSPAASPSSDGLPAKTYVPPQKIVPSISR